MKYLPTSVEPVNTSASTSGCKPRGLAGLLAEARHHVQHAFRHPRLQGQLGQAQGGERRPLGRLEHHRVAGGQAGASFQAAMSSGKFHGTTAPITPAARG